MKTPTFANLQRGDLVYDIDYNQGFVTIANCEVAVIDWEYGGPSTFSVSGQLGAEMIVERNGEELSDHELLFS